MYLLQAEPQELYTVKELLSDLANCEAKRIVILADQANSEMLMKSLKSSEQHERVILYTFGAFKRNETKENNYNENKNGDLTRIWARSIGSDSLTCLKHVQNVRFYFILLLIILIGQLIIDDGGFKCH
jgi:nitrate reductase NapAB chaperone NapD